MKKTLLFAFLVLFAFSVSVCAAQESQEEQEAVELPSFWPALPPEGKVMVLARGVETFRAAVSGAGVEHFHGIAAQYPIRDIGVSIGPALLSETETEKVAAVRVYAVFRDSPAATAGILPGDWLLKANGTDSCRETFSQADPEEAGPEKLQRFKDCVGSFDRTIQGSEGPVTLLIERGGTQHEIIVSGTAELGAEVVDFINQNLPRWEAYFTRLAPELDAIERKISESAGDDAKLTECFQDLVVFQRRLQQPFDEFDAYAHTRIDTLTKE